MTIILIGPAPPWRGGIAHHTSRLAQELSRRHRVELITFSRQYPSMLFPGSSQTEDGAEVPGVPVSRTLDSINPVSWIRTGLRVRKNAPALILFPYSIPFFAPCFGTIAAVARRTPGIRAVFLCHNVIPHERRAGDRILTKYAFSFGDGFIVQSETVRSELLEMKPDATVAFAHHPVYESFGEPVARDDARDQLGLSGKRILLFFGYVRPYKGLPVLLEALSQVPDVSLVIAGEFYESERLYTDMIARLGIGDRTHLFNRYIPKADVPRYFSAADAVVVPYRSASQSGIIQLAYNFNRPVIASTVGGLSEVVSDRVTGRLVPPGDPGALASAIRGFYENGEDRTMPAEVERSKQQFSWEALANAVESFAGDRS